MVATAESVEWIQVANDVEAVMLEYNLIKQHRPRFNVRLVDDKSYPFLAVTVSDEWPRPMVMRGAKRKGVRYYGPFAHAYAIRETLDLLLRTFPLRTCSDRQVRAAPAPGAAVPAVPHREVLGPVRGRDRPRGLPGADPGAPELPRRRHRRHRQAPRRRDEGGGRRAGVRAGGPRARPADQRAQGHRAPADGGRAQRGLRRDRAWPRTSWRPPSRSSSCAGAGSSAARASSSTRSRTSRPAS